MVIRDSEFPDWQRIILAGFVEIQPLEIPYVVTGTIAPIAADTTSAVTDAADLTAAVTDAAGATSAVTDATPASAIYRFPSVRRPVRLVLTRHLEASMAVLLGVSVGAIALLIILILVLRFCGFFKRKQKPGMEDVNK